jgi:hypothetical protein
MNAGAQTSRRESSGTRIPPVLALFAAGLVHALLPSGAFGSHDVAARALISAGTASGAALFLMWLNKRRGHASV